MSLISLFLTLLSMGTALVSAVPVQSDVTIDTSEVKTCFPALNFKMPTTLPKDNTQWWCDPKDEFAFLGFSYEVTACKCLGIVRPVFRLTSFVITGQSPSQLNKEFSDIRNHFRGRYVRLYGFCDNEGF